VLGELAVALHRDQLAARGQPVQRFPEVLAGHALDGAGGSHHAVQRTVFGKPFGGGLGAHLVDARHVVHRVTHQGQVVDDSLGRHAELGEHPQRVEALVAHGVDQRHLRRDELRQVLVAGGDQHRMAAGLAESGQGADDVVGLDARHRQHRPAQQAHHLVDERDLRAQLLGHRRALRLVLGVPGVAEGRAGGVEHAGRVRRRVALAQLAQHGHHAVHRAGRLALGPAQVGHGVEGAVQVAAAVDEQQQGGRRCVHQGILGGRP
jgi:hypothetical protein